MAAPIDRDRVAALTEQELDLFARRTPVSLDRCRTAVTASMPLGVPTGVCSVDPYPITIDHGAGAYLVDVDGNQYVDYANGFGTTVFGHAHPKITEAIARQAGRGTHFGALTDPVVSWAQHLCGRFGLNWVRFSSSGTEATMDALRLARAHTGRSKIIKIEGGYHGSHDYALVSNNAAVLDERAGPDGQPASQPIGEGISPRVLDEVIAVPFNDTQAARRALAAGDVAALIIEPILFNVGTIWPRDGYLRDLRDACDEHGALLIFDEVKSAATVAWGGAEELFGVRPHIKCVAKGIGGGLPVGAFGDTDGRCFELVESWRVPHLGTFAGNPLAAAAGYAALTDVLTRDAYLNLNHHGRRLRQRLQRVIDQHDLPAYVTGAGAKGCVVWVDGEPLRDFRDYQRRFDMQLGYLAWLYLLNRGVFLAPGQDEQWTHSVFHGDVEADLFVGAFEQLAAELRAA